MGMNGIDWRLWGKWARSRMSSTTLINGGKNSNGKRLQQHGGSRFTCNF